MCGGVKCFDDTGSGNPKSILVNPFPSYRSFFHTVYSSIGKYLWKVILVTVTVFLFPRCHLRARFAWGFSGTSTQQRLYGAERGNWKGIECVNYTEDYSHMKHTMAWEWTVGNFLSPFATIECRSFPVAIGDGGHKAVLQWSNSNSWNPHIFPKPFCLERIDLIWVNISKVISKCQEAEIEIILLNN